MSTKALLKHFFLTNCSDPDVVEFSPNALEVVFDEREVVATFCASVMDAHGVKVIWNIAESLVGLLDFSCNRFYLLLETLDLISCIFDVALQVVNHKLFLSWLGLPFLLKGQMHFDLVKQYESFWNLRDCVCSLVLDELQSQANGFENVDFGSAKLLVLLQTALEEVDVHS